jgi:hypothetical protein
MVVDLADLATLSVVERRVHYKPMKHRATTKFSTAAKAKILKTLEVEIERVAVGDSA